MPASDTESPAARLCAACGMCCNGVLFYSVRLQPSDSARRLEKLGLKIKRRSDGLHMLQPCPAHTGSSCRVYESRPERCRLFVCRQVLRVEAGEIPEGKALDNIATALHLTARVKESLEKLGDSREHKALVTRYETALTPPFDPGSSPDREILISSMAELENFLAREFRIENATP